MVASLDGKTKKLLLENATNALYFDGHLLFGRDSSLMMQPFDLKRLELSGDASIVVPEKLSYWDTKNFLIFSIARDGSLVYFPTVDSEHQLRLVGRQGNEIRPIGDPGVVLGGAFSPDGKSIAYARGAKEGEVDIWMHDVERHRTSRVTFAPGFYWNISWSPDASMLFFTAQPRGVGEVMSKSLQTGEVSTFEGGAEWTGSFTPDGKRFVFSSNTADTGYDLWIKDVGNPDAKAELLLQTPAHEGDGRVSPNGRWVAYASDAFGRPEVYARRLGGVEQWQMSSQGGLAPRWSRGGAELVYCSPEGKVMAVPLGTGERLDPGEPVELFDLRQRSDFWAPALSDVSPDGSQLLVTTRAGDQPEPVMRVKLHALGRPRSR